MESINKQDIEYIVNYYNTHISYIDTTAYHVDMCFANNIFINFYAYVGTGVIEARKARHSKKFKDFLEAMIVIPS